MSELSFISFTHHPALPEAYNIGKSNCSSSASSDTKRSKISFTTSSGRLSGLSILLMTTIGLKPCFNAFPRTNLVCGIGPSAESTSKITPSAIPSTLSTSPPKSACPGVSIILILISPQGIDVGLAKIVIPLSFSRSPESITLSSTC